MDRNAQIAEIERELGILRARRALYAKWGRILKLFFTVVLPVSAIALALTVVAIFHADPLVAAFLVLMLGVLSAVVWMMFSPRWNGGSWSDVASPAVPFARPYGRDLRSMLFATSPTDAELLEEQIAEREHRLATLRVQP